MSFRIGQRVEHVNTNGLLLAKFVGAVGTVVSEEIGQWNQTGYWVEIDSMPNPPDRELPSGWFTPTENLRAIDGDSSRNYISEETLQIFTRKQRNPDDLPAPKTVKAVGRA